MSGGYARVDQWRQILNFCKIFKIYVTTPLNDRVFKVNIYILENNFKKVSIYKIVTKKIYY